MGGAYRDRAQAPDPYISQGWSDIPAVVPHGSSPGLLRVV